MDTLRVPGPGLLAAAWVAAACGSPGEDAGGPAGLQITVTAGPSSSEEAPLPFSLTGTTFTVDVAAVPEGSVADGWITIRSEPGEVLSVAAPGVIRSNVPLIGGRATGVQVTIAKAFGPTRIWAEDLGFVPYTAGPVSESACGNGVDDDGDGRTDYGDDPGCAWTNDDSETEGSHAVGVNDPPFWFANPRIADVQGAGLPGFPGESPLAGRSITIEGGTMVVTRVSVDGLYVTDIAETRGLNHLFAYNFNTPYRVRVCDRIVALGGIVGEFYGYTELGYPSWTLDPAATRVSVPAGPGDCPVPEPVELTRAVLDDPMAMESLEAGLAKVTNGTITSQFIDCDYDGDGVNYSSPAEETCTDDCDANLDCTELSQFWRYGQFGVITAGATASERGKVLVITREVYPGFDPRAHAGDGIALIRGTMREVEFLANPWILEIRCRDDLVASGVPRPMWEACVTPIDDDEGYTR